MGLNKSKGQMYPWVTHTHAHLGGVCPHKCSYCYVDSFRQRVPKYQGELRLIESQLKVNYGGFSENYPNGKTIFIENCNDMFAIDVPTKWIQEIIDHCHRYPDNMYVFQTKNPDRYRHYCFPEKYILGVTIETNRRIPNIGNAPNPASRVSAMLEQLMKTKFITIEPILDFDIDVLSDWIKRIEPDFVNIGADSKGHGLQEPSIEKVMELADAIQGHGIEIREKHNLDRLRKKG